jgi:hypothetical protein
MLVVQAGGKLGLVADRTVGNMMEQVSPWPFPITSHAGPGSREDGAGMQSEMLLPSQLRDL